MVAARQGGGDPDTNITLRTLVQKARSVNMPSDNVERAIKKGTGELEGDALEEMAYEGYAPGGVAVLVEVLSDNRNRSSSDIKHVFSKYNGNLASQGSVSRLFNRKGQIVVADNAVKEDKLLELILESGAEDMTHDDGQYEILTDPNVFSDVMDVLEKEGIPTDVSEVTMIPESSVPIADKGTASSLLKFIEALEDLDDVQNVHTNFDIDDELLAQLDQE